MFLISIWVVELARFINIFTIGNSRFKINETDNDGRSSVQAQMLMLIHYLFLVFKP